MFNQAHKYLSLLTSSLLLFSCTQVDNYMLGKDNTPKPSELKPIQSKVKVVEKWSAPLPTASNWFKANSKLKPEIVDNVVYTADSSGLIQANNRANGQLIWSKKINHRIIGGLTVSHGKMALSTDDSSIVLLNQVDGSQLWKNTVSSHVLSKPVIVNQRVLAKTIDGNLYCFDLNTGHKLWVSDHGAPSLILKASSSPAIVQNKFALVGYSDGKLDGVDLSNGRILWQRSIAYANGASDVERLVDIDADPIVRGDIAYLGTYQGFVGAFSLKEGQFIWRKPASIYKNMVLDDHALYITDSNDVIWALNRANGNVFWKQESLKARQLTEPVLLGKRLIVGDKTGILHVLSTDNGELISRTELGSALTIAPVIAGNKIYVVTNNGKLSQLSVG